MWICSKRKFPRPTEVHRLDPVEGSEQAGERPALVLSPDFINENGLFVRIAAITSKKTERFIRLRSPFELR
jgi:mRNA-degrading endonuclease toxin of MazEF toxin-antitoxin module